MELQMQRMFIAYALMALLFASITAVALHLRHNAPARSYQRRLKREQAEHFQRMASPRTMEPEASIGGGRAVSDAPEIFASSSNGDRWGLQHDVDAEALHVVHFANAASGGGITQLTLSDFLSGSGDKPEQKALLRHLGSLLASPLGNCEPMRSVEIRTLRGADLVDVERGLCQSNVADRALAC